MADIIWHSSPVHSLQSQASPRRRQRSLTRTSTESSTDGERRLSTDCVVCLEPVRASASRTLCCGHSTWHADCIERWLSHSPRCPLCAVATTEDTGAAVISAENRSSIEPEWALDERRVHTIVRGRRASSVTTRPRRYGRRSAAARFRRRRGCSGGVAFLRLVKCVL